MKTPMKTPHRLATAWASLVTSWLMLAAAPALAAPIVFDTAPFQGSAANPNDGVRTVFGGNERFLPAFDFNAGPLVFNHAGFAVAGLSFFNGLAADVPATGVNLVVLESTDNDGNAATPFNAGTAANLIAAAIGEDGAGFFVYHNSVLGLNRLVYSSNLNSPTGDLAILARFTAPTRGDAIALLPSFDARHFALNAVPEPASWALAAAALALVGAARRGRGRPAV